jgi:CspA family cold shock protein
LLLTTSFCHREWNIGLRSVCSERRHQPTDDDLIPYAGGVTRERRHTFIKIQEVVESTITLSRVLIPNGDYMATMNGTIKTLTGKGFGFIATADGQEYFFHQSACADMRFDELREGQAVTFEKGQGPKGPRAENVRRA